MTNPISVTTISDEVSTEVATAILTKQKEIDRDPQELLKIVLTVHSALRELSAKAHAHRSEKIDRLFGGRP